MGPTKGNQPSKPMPDGTAKGGSTTTVKKLPKAKAKRPPGKQAYVDRVKAAAKARGVSYKVAKKGVQQVKRDNRST